MIVFMRWTFSIFVVVVVLFFGFFSEVWARAPLLKSKAKKETAVVALPTAENLEAAILKGSGPNLFVIEHGLKRLIPSMEVLRAFHFGSRRIEQVPDKVMESFVKGDPLGLFSSWPDGTLLKGSQSRVYLVSKNTRRWVVNEKVFVAWGFAWDRITTVPDDVLNRLNEGSPAIGPAPKHPESSILSGPEEASTLETTSILFTFSGFSPAGARNVNFETYLQGFDSQWVPTTRDQRSFDLESKDATYTFFVRAVSQDNAIDPTPARRSFSVRLSPFSKYVRIASRSGQATIPDNEAITLEVLSSSPSPVDLTDYTITNSLGHSFHLPKVNNDYRAGGETSLPDPLVVAPGGRVIITLGKSPLRASVRVNRCMGYLTRTGGAFQSLGNFFFDCPQLPQEVIERHTGKTCLDYLKSQSACSVANPIPFPDNVRLGFTCIDFISQHYTYNGCVDDHRAERDFYKDEWRVEIGFPKDFFPTGKERVELRDREKKLVHRLEPFF